MVLCLKTRESRSLPGLLNACLSSRHNNNQRPPNRGPKLFLKHAVRHDAGWSSPVARQAHNLKVTGSNPVPATKSRTPGAKTPGVFAFEPLLIDLVCLCEG